MRYLKAAALLSLGPAPLPTLAAQTPIQHVIVLFQENISFDHYFGTYPNALNKPGSACRRAKSPSVNGLTPAAVAQSQFGQPVRLAPSQAATCDMDHEYKAEQEAFNGGLMDKFVEKTSAEDKACSTDGVMGYFDGKRSPHCGPTRSLRHERQFLQHRVRSDASAINLYREIPTERCRLAEVWRICNDGRGHDDCRSRSDVRRLLLEAPTAAMQAPRSAISSMQKAHLGLVPGGFRPTDVKNGKAVCGDKSVNLTGATVGLQRPSSAVPVLPIVVQSASSAADRSDRHGRPANHQYDLRDFYAAQVPASCRRSAHQGEEIPGRSCRQELFKPARRTSPSGHIINAIRNPRCKEYADHHRL
jgi:phospholipase C